MGASRPSDAPHTVGDIALAAGVSAQTIREWERRGLLEAQRTTGGQRRFTESARSEAISLAAGRRRRGPAPSSPDASDDGVELARTGARIRSARLKSGLSQGEAARQVGVSRSFVSTVERGQSGVSVHVLAAMADVFGIPMGDFAPQAEPTAVLHPAERPKTVLADGVTWEELATPGRYLEPALLHVPAGQSSGGRITRPGETFVFVLRGTLTFKVDGTSDHLTLAEGDALLIDAASAYSWYNPDPDSASCLWIEQVPRVSSIRP